MVYSTVPRRVLKSATFHDWFSHLVDRGARIRIAVRADRLACGNPGDVRSVGAGLSELRIDYGPGYRVYFMRRDGSIVLLCGGDKRTQAKDIQRANQMAEDWLE